MLVVADPVASPPHVAYAIGRAVGGAVERNRLRRRLRPIMSELAPSLPPGWYLIGARPSARDCSSAVLRAHLASLPERAGIGSNPAGGPGPVRP